MARRRRRVVYGPITYRRVDADPVPIAADAPSVRVGPPRDFECGAVQRSDGRLSASFKAVDDIAKEGALGRFAELGNICTGMESSTGTGEDDG